MHPAQLPEQLRTECYCPSCGDHLVLGKCADPWAVCLASEDGHRFFILPEPPFAPDSAAAASLSFPEINGRSPEATAHFWLSEPAARSILNRQLAEILRAILEARHVLDEPRFSFCPVCGGALTNYEQPDIWVKGLRCMRGHSWALRGGRLFSMIGGERIELRAEDPDAVVTQLITTWLKGGPYLEPNLHESVRRILTSSPLCPKDGIKHGD
jgi:hypothetical protein